MDEEPESERLYYYNHQHHGSKFKFWLYRVSNSRREQLRLAELTIMAMIVLLLVVIGFYYFGPGS